MTSKEIQNLDKSAGFLKSELLRNSILDPEGVHHEFVSGAHGRKLDFDKIKTGSTLYNLWVGVMAEKTRELYDQVPSVLVGVANGTNRLARSMAPLLGDHVQGIATEKLSAKEVGLTDLGKLVLQQTDPEMVLIVEDVGTLGTNSSSVAKSVREAGFDNLEVINTWQRSETLPFLDELSVPYNAVITDVLPTFTSEDCLELPDGYCHQNIELIPHGQ
jgi:orotate phosphoribosyltransferase